MNGGRAPPRVPVASTTFESLLVVGNSSIPTQGSNSNMHVVEREGLSANFVHLMCALFRSRKEEPPRFCSLSRGRFAGPISVWSVAHRGSSATHEGNSLPAFVEAVRVGANMIELDVVLCKTGEVGGRYVNVGSFWAISSQPFAQYVLGKLYGMPWRRCADPSARRL